MIADSIPNDAPRAAPDAMIGKARVGEQIAELLDEAATLLAGQGASPFRVAAYRRGAAAVRALRTDLHALVTRAGRAGLEAIPGIGPSLAASIEEIVRTGRWAQLARLRGTSDPERLFRNIAGIGPELAQRIHETLHVDTLEALEIAAYDGRLGSVPGVGARRALAIRSQLAVMLAHVRAAPRWAGEPIDEPDVALLLAVDHEYRALARADRLPKIAPRRFNPEGKAWLPVLHADRGGWHFTALYSNTARAHELGRISDWVVVYFSKDNRPEGQRTIVTETHGELAGRRVVRGRELDCREAAYGQPLT